MTCLSQRCVSGAAAIAAGIIMNRMGRRAARQLHSARRRAVGSRAQIRRACDAGRGIDRVFAFRCAIGTGTHHCANSSMICTARSRSRFYRFFAFANAGLALGGMSTGDLVHPGYPGCHPGAVRRQTPGHYPVCRNRRIAAPGAVAVQYQLDAGAGCGLCLRYRFYH